MENPRQARVVELQYFGGLSVEQIGALLEIAPRSVKRDWALARIWLFRELRPGKKSKVWPFSGSGSALVGEGG
jgi:DNA-directed RNA polymerase specialized sigma24 family protein